jgi:hypothetical protein
MPCNRILADALLISKADEGLVFAIPDPNGEYTLELNNNKRTINFSNTRISIIATMC